MNIKITGLSTREELLTAWRLVASCTATLACGCSLVQDEPDIAADLRRLCRAYCNAYDQRFT